MMHTIPASWFKAARLWLAGALGLLLAVPLLSAEFQVNRYTTASQYEPSVALDADGDFVVVWASYAAGAAGQDGDYGGIFGQRFNSAGVALADEFQINTATAGYQRAGHVALDADGDFVVVWVSYEDAAAGQDGDDGGIFAQRFNAAGVPQAAEFQANTVTAGDQWIPSVESESNGDFIVVWVTFGAEVSAQRFTSAGVAIGAEFTVNTYVDDSQNSPAVAMDADGDFVVVWESEYQDDGLGGVFAQRYDSSGAAVAIEFQVATRTENDQIRPLVAMDSVGNFVVTWTDVDRDGDTSAVFAKRFNSSGVNQGQDFQINQFTVNSQFPRSVVMSDSGFLITWTSNLQDGSTHGSFARRYNAAGAAIGGEFQVSDYTVGAQRAWAGMDDSGDVVIAWQDADRDGDDTGVFAEQFDAPTSTPTPTNTPTPTATPTPTRRFPLSVPIRAAVSGGQE